MNKKTKKILFTLLAIFLVTVAVGGSWFFSSLVIGRETRALSDSNVRIADEGFELPTPELIEFNSGDITLRGWYMENELEGQCGVVLLHGYTSNRYGSAHFASLFWERGCDLLLYDARGHGDSSPSYHTYGYHEKEDGVAAVTWLQERTGLPQEKIGLAGVSYGAATVLQMTPLVPDVAFVLADSAYQDMETIVTLQGEALFGLIGTTYAKPALALAAWRADFVLDEVSPMRSVVNSEVPIILIHARGDDFTPYTHSEAIYNSSNQETTVLYITDWGAEHGASMFADYAAYKGYVDTFLTEQVPGFGLDGGR